MIRASADDAGRINALAKRHFKQDANFSGFLSNPLNVAFLVPGGGAFFVWHGPRIYEAHCCFDERGKEARDLSLVILERMRVDHRARIIWAAIPDKDRKVKTYARWLGFRSDGPFTLANEIPGEMFILENE